MEMGTSCVFVRIRDGKGNIMFNLVNGLHVHCMNLKVTVTI